MDAIVPGYQIGQFGCREHVAHVVVWEIYTGEFEDVLETGGKVGKEGVLRCEFPSAAAGSVAEAEGLVEACAV